ncbi:phos_pyr_kin domain-containing protein, partial [Haematococcus lacustris]
MDVRFSAQGYVGNKVAVFPLQLLGFDVDPILSVQFSNHTGYPSFQGSVFDGSHLQSLVQGLAANQLLGGYSHLLTGYIGSLTLLEAVVETVEALQAANGGAVTYVCDPVMGDEGRLYVPAALVDAFRLKVVPLAAVLVPNQFEAELLAQTGPITSVASGLKACQALHALGPHTVVITSMSMAEDPEHIILLASTLQPQANGLQCLTLRIPRIHAYFTGTG